VTGIPLRLGGAAVVVLVLADVVATTLTIGTGAGPLTRRVLGPAWRVLLRLHRRDSTSAWLSTAGTVLLMTTVLIWVALLWGGWTLVYLSDPGSLVDAATGRPVGGLDVLYYAGFTVFTLGVGDVVATTPGWRVLTAGAGFSGLFLVTLAITYLLSVVSAVVSRRTVAVQIHTLGPTATAMVVQGWTGSGFSPTFLQQLTALGERVVTVAEQHLAYPVLHYFHSRRPESAARVAIARLDDVLLLLRAAVAPGVRPHPSVTVPVHRAVARYLTAAEGTSAVPRRTVAPPVPSPRPLAEAGIPLGDPAGWDRAAAVEVQRRRTLSRLVHADGWSWPGA
jgi:Ion channel